LSTFSSREPTAGEAIDAIPTGGLGELTGLVEELVGTCHHVAAIGAAASPTAAGTCPLRRQSGA
jgi:hypothetical protein